MSDTCDSEDDERHNALVAGFAKIARERKEQEQQKKEHDERRAALKEARKKEVKSSKNGKKQKTKSTVNSTDDDDSGDVSEDDLSSDDISSDEDDGEGDEDEDDDDDDDNSSEGSRSSSGGSVSHDDSNDEDDEDNDDKKSDTSTEAGYTFKHMAENVERKQKTLSEAIERSQNIYETLNAHLEDSKFDSTEVKDEELLGNLKRLDAESNLVLDKKLQEALVRLQNYAPSCVIHESITTIVEHVGLLSRAVHLVMLNERQKDNATVGKDYKRIPNGTMKRLQSSILALNSYSEQVLPQIQTMRYKLDALHTNASNALGKIPSDWQSFLDANNMPQ